MGVLKKKQPEKKENDGFISLFNGKDLSHWQTTGNWLPQKDGSLLIQPKPGQEGWQRYSDYLISKEKFGDFILTLEYKYPPKGNSGVFFNNQYEIQILNAFENTTYADGTAASFYGQHPPLVNPCHPKKIPSLPVMQKTQNCHKMS